MTRLLPTLMLSLACLAGESTAQTVGCIHTRGADCSVGRFDCASAVVDGRLVVFGGFDGPAIDAITRVDAYDPVLDAWTRLADLPRPVNHAPTVVVGREVWLVGGFVGDNPGVATDEVWRYRVDHDDWVPGPALPHPVAGGAAVLLSGRIHYFGGVLADRNTGSTSHIAIDTQNPGGGWSTLAPLPVARNHLAGVEWLGRIWAIGGQVRHDTNPADTDHVHMYDPANDAWSVGPDLPFARSHCEASTFSLPAGIFVVGGKGGGLGRQVVNDVTALRAGASAWRALAPVPRSFAGGAAAALGDELVVACGNDADLNAPVDVYRRPLAASIGPRIRIQCGEGEYSGSSFWCSDLGSDAGVLELASPTMPIAGTTDDPLYRVQRKGPNQGQSYRLSYRLACEPGAVRVRLHFCEVRVTGPGERVFDVVVQGRTHEQNLDVFAEVGQAHALVRTYDVEAPNGTVDIELVASVNRPTIAAIDLDPLGGAHLSRRCGGQPSTVGVVADLALEGSTAHAGQGATLLAEGVPAGAASILLQSSGAAVLAVGSSQLCIGPDLYRRLVASSVGGTVRFELDFSRPGPIPPSLDPGTSWDFQAWYRDGVGFGLTDAMTLEFAP